MLSICAYFLPTRAPLPVARAEKRAFSADGPHGASNRALDEQRAQKAPYSSHEVNVI